MFTRITTAAAIVGAAMAPIAARSAPIAQPAQPARLDVALVSSGAPLDGSDTAIIVGPTTLSTPSALFADTAENLYLHPLGFDHGALSSSVCFMSGTDPCSGTLQVLTTPETTAWNQSMAAGAADVTNAVEAEFKANPGVFSATHPLTVFGYSQGTDDESIAMTQLAQAGIPTNAVHFVFIGDPADTNGMLTNIQQVGDSLFGSWATQLLLDAFDVQNVVAGNPGAPTPNDLFPTNIFTINGDGFADFLPDYKSGGFASVVSGITTQHLEYLGLTPAQIADATPTSNGDIVNSHISGADINSVVALANAAPSGVTSAVNGFLYDTPLGTFLLDAADGNWAGILGLI